MTIHQPDQQAEHTQQANKFTISSRSEAPVLSEESVRELLRAVAPTPARQLTAAQRDQLEGMLEPRWQEQASCASAHPAAWYPETWSPASQHVIRICAACPVRRSCLAVALLWNEHGIWAGTSPTQRRQGYRRLRAGVSVSSVVQLLLAQADRLTTATATTADVPSPVNDVPRDSQQTCEAA